jgi:aryl-alcohol dehydrogenase-like predicted oxidoreductase
MNYRLLGKSGLRVSEFCLGTMTFGEDWGWGSSKDEAKKIYDAFREADGTFIDTANIYTNGTSESFLGEFLKGHREGVVLATKFTNAAPGTDPNAAGNHRKNMVQAVEASLKRLQTDYIDLYWVHIWDQITPVEEVMRAFGRSRSSGKGALCRNLRCAGLVDRSGEYAGYSSRLVAIRWAANRIQPDRANSRAGTDPDG